MSLPSEREVKIRVHKKQKGATTRFTVILRDCPKKPKKEHYTLFRIGNDGNQAVLRFISVRKNDQLILQLSCRKVNATTNTTYKINIICGDKCYLKEHLCLEYWSDWIEIVDFENKYPSTADGFYSQKEVNVTIYKYTKTAAGLLKFFNDSDLTDFHLSTGEGSVAVHRAYLAAHSDVFKAMLTGKWKETDNGIIEIKDLALETLKNFKEYLYLGTLPDYNGLLPLLVLASEYCVEELKSECITRLALTVVPEHVHSLLEFACKWKLPELCFAVTHLTPDHVIHKSYQLKEKPAGTKKL